MEIPRDVMAGYTLMTTEAMDQLPEGVVPTHVFIQGGCGGLAGAVGADLWHRYGDKMPHFTVVEPVPAACLYESARAGEPQLVDIVDESLMAGLSCGEVSLLGWQILKSGAQHFLTISDAPVAPLMKLLAAGSSGDSAIVAGESAIAGLAGLIGAMRNEPLAREMNLNQSSRVLVFGTEGATDPEVFEALVGTSAEKLTVQG
jgi:diaminopropionate ammonia-lyase